MSSSATIGSLSLLTLALALDASHRGILGKSSRNAYERLTEILRECIDADDDALLEQSRSKIAIRARLAMIVDQSFEYRAKIKSLAKALVHALKADATRGSLGISLRKLDFI